MAFSYMELARKATTRGGVDISFKFTDDATGKEFIKTMFFSRPAPEAADITARCNHSAERFEFKINPLNEVSIEDINAGELIQKLVVYIRNNPTVTAATLLSVIETQYPNLPWKTDKLFEKIKHYLFNHYGATPTFDQFKNYVITHKFTGVDD